MEILWYFAYVASFLRSVFNRRKIQFFRLQILETVKEPARRILVLWGEGTQHIIGRAKTGEDAALVLDIGLRVALGGLDGGVAEPVLDDVKIDFGLEQMDGGGVAEAVGGYPAAGEIRALTRRPADMLLDEGAKAEAGEGTAALVDEEGFFRAGNGFAAVALEIKLKKLNGGRPQGRGAGLAALPGDGDKAAREIKPGRLSSGGLLSAGAGVVEKSEDGEVAEAVKPVQIDLGEDGLQFFAGEE